MRAQEIYVIGIPEYWQTLTPPLQHSLAGFGVMINQFEPLVRRGKKGILEPLGAKSWDFSQDRRRLRLKIDTSRRFSDGTSLCADDFKKSWENGLRIQPKSSNSSLADALANLKGFSSLKENKGIEGIRVVGTDELELEFVKPVRGVLEHLSGVRYSAYKTAGENVIGTGPYVITEKDRVLTLVPNPYYAGKAPALTNVKIVVAPTDTAPEKLRSGEINALLFAENAKIPECSKEHPETVRCVFGQEGKHFIVVLNGMPGRFFSDPLHRRAFQSLVLKHLNAPADTLPQFFRSNNFLRDPQSFLKFQAGRLPDDEAQTIINSGEQHLQRFIEATQSHPLQLSDRWPWLVDLLLENGIKLSGNMRTSLDEKERIKMCYKTFEPDILPMTASVYDGDPDCLYHLLGRHGAIFSPMQERKGVADGLEDGRKLVDPASLAPHYQGVARKILEEVPYIHLGFYYRGVAYNSNRVRLNESFVNRNNQSITVLHDGQAIH